MSTERLAHKTRGFSFDNLVQELDQELSASNTSLEHPRAEGPSIAAAGGRTEGAAAATAPSDALSGRRASSRPEGRASVALPSPASGVPVEQGEAEQESPTAAALRKAAASALAGLQRTTGTASGDGGRRASIRPGGTRGATSALSTSGRTILLEDRILEGEEASEGSEPRLITDREARGESERERSSSSAARNPVVLASSASSSTSSFSSGGAVVVVGERERVTPRARDPAVTAARSPGRASISFDGRGLAARTAAAAAAAASAKLSPTGRLGTRASISTGPVGVTRPVFPARPVTGDGTKAPVSRPLGAIADDDDASSDTFSSAKGLAPSNKASATQGFTGSARSTTASRSATPSGVASAKPLPLGAIDPESGAAFVSASNSLNRPAPVTRLPAQAPTTSIARSRGPAASVGSPAAPMPLAFSKAETREEFTSAMTIVPERNALGNDGSRSRASSDSRAPPSALDARAIKTLPLAASGAEASEEFASAVALLAKPSPSSVVVPPPTVRAMGASRSRSPTQPKTARPVAPVIAEPKFKPLPLETMDRMLAEEFVSAVALQNASLSPSSAVNVAPRSRGSSTSKPAPSGADEAQVRSLPLTAVDGMAPELFVSALSVPPKPAPPTAAEVKSAVRTLVQASTGPTTTVGQLDPARRASLAQFLAKRGQPPAWSGISSRNLDSLPGSTPTPGTATAAPFATGGSGPPPKGISKRVDFLMPKSILKNAQERSPFSSFDNVQFQDASEVFSDEDEEDEMGSASDEEAAWAFGLAGRSRESLTSSTSTPSVAVPATDPPRLLAGRKSRREKLRQEAFPAESSDDEPLLVTQEMLRRRSANASTTLFSLPLFVEAQGGFVSFELPTDVTAFQLRSLAFERCRSLPSEDPQAYVLYETCPALGIERPIREWEPIAPILAAWPEGSFVALRTVAHTGYVDTVTAIRQLRGKFPIAQGNLHVQLDRGTWSRAFFAVEEDALVVYAGEEEVRGTPLLSLSNFDVYTKIWGNARADGMATPTLSWFALRSTNPASFFEDAGDYCRILCCEREERVREWVASLQLFKSEMMLREAPALLQHFPRVEGVLRNMSRERAKYMAAFHRATAGSASLESVAAASAPIRSSRERGSSISSSASQGSQGQGPSKPLVSFEPPNYREVEVPSRGEQQRRLADQRREEMKRSGKSLVELIDDKSSPAAADGGGI